MSKVPNLIALRDHLLDAARKGRPIRIETPFYKTFIENPTEDDAARIWRELKAAGTEYFRGRYGKKDYKG